MRDHRGSPSAADQSGEPSSDLVLRFRERLESLANEKAPDSTSRKVRRYLLRSRWIERTPYHQFLLFLDPEYPGRHRTSQYNLRRPQHSDLVGDQLSLFEDQEELRDDFRMALLRILARDHPGILLEAVNELILSGELKNLDSRTSRLLGRVLADMLRKDMKAQKSDVHKGADDSNRKSGE